MLFRSGGYGQLKKTVTGLGMFYDDLPISGSYTQSGALRFPVEDTWWNRLQAGLFGQWASENAQDYIENNRKPLEEKQLQEFMDLDIPIADYWEYREGLIGLATLEEKAAYINSLDLPIEKKNLLINNLTSRKDPIDLTDYDLYGSLDELDYATKNPEKYGAVALIGYDNYKTYNAALNNIKAGDNTKAKKKEYIWSLDIPEGQKCLLFKLEYPADKTYDNTVFVYVNSQKGITAAEKKAILKNLGLS